MLQPVNEGLQAVQGLHLPVLLGVQVRLQNPRHPGQLGLVQRHHVLLALQTRLQHHGDQVPQEGVVLGVLEGGSDVVKDGGEGRVGGVCRSVQERL